jgi:four helix bundle suffix protein
MYLQVKKRKDVQCEAHGTNSVIKLTNVARASLEELRLDYEDYLRQHGQIIWDKNDSRRQRLIDARCKTADDVALWVQKENDYGRSGQSGHGELSGRFQQERPNLSYKSNSAGTAANAALVLLAVACSLLDRQIAAQTAAFESEGGFTERLYRVRSEKRSLARPSSTKSKESTKSTED